MENGNTPSDTPVPPDGFAAMMANIAAASEQSEPEALPTVKGSSRMYHAVGLGKGASWFVNIELLMRNETAFVIRFISIGKVEKPPVHLNYRLTSEVVDGNSKKVAFYYDQHKIVVPSVAGSLMGFNSMAEETGMDSIIGGWIARQLTLEGLEVTATKDQLEYLVKAVHPTVKPTVTMEFSLPNDIVHLKKSYDSKED